MCVGSCGRYISYSLSSYNIEVGASQQRAREMFVYLEGVSDLCQLIWGSRHPGCCGEYTRQSQGRDGDSHTPPHPILAGLSHSGRLPASYFRRAPG